MSPDLSPFDSLDFEAAAVRLEGVVERTPLVSVQLPSESADERLCLRAKLENRQVCGAFKARGAWNNVAQLSSEERERGVVTCSSGNHGRALAWAAQRAGVKATIVMPRDAYPNKIEACRELGARVVLSRDRLGADEDAAELAAEGLVFIHPYDRPGTVAGAGTVGLELLQDWPEVELVLVPVGGGGLVAGVSLCLKRALGEQVRVVGVEPAGAPSMQRGLAAGEVVSLPEIQTCIQGLCPTNSGALNIEICSQTLDDVWLVEDAPVLEAMDWWVAQGEVVEPAGSATLAAVREGMIPEDWLRDRTAENPLRAVIVVSGGNPAPEQLEQSRSRA
jgi:threonine dehydratase